MTEVLPNFFIVGAPKAGTTSLYHLLTQHPQIYMSPVKEPCYFASEIRPENFSAEHEPRIRREAQELRQSIFPVPCSKSDSVGWFQNGTTI